LFDGDGIIQLIHGRDANQTKWSLIQLFARIIFQMSLIINPIIKDNKKKAFEINNFRPVSISNCIAQIFERIILKLSPNLQISEDNQFGFKMGLSTYQPLFLVKETISKYKRTKSPCYVVSLDAEKAFDSLWRNG
jgi:hypothetical protein